MTINYASENFIRQTALLEKAYEKKTLYKKAWDPEKKELVDLTGLDWFEQEILHLIDWHPYDHDQKRFQSIFKECTKLLKSSDNSFNSEKDQAPRMDHFSPQALTDSMLAIVRYRFSFKRKPKKVSDPVEKIFTAFQRHLQQCQDALKKVDSLRLAVQRLPEAELLTLWATAYERETNKNSKKAEVEGDSLFVFEEDNPVLAAAHEPSSSSEEAPSSPPSKSDLLDLVDLVYDPISLIRKAALTAHDIYASTFNDQTALEIAKQVDNLQDLVDSDNPEDQKLLTWVLNLIRYGDDFSAVVDGKKNPTFFWPFTKVWNTVKWWFSWGDRKKELELDVSSYDKTQQDLIDKLVNQRYAEMGDGLIEAYHGVLTSKKENLGNNFGWAPQLKKNPASMIKEIKKAYITDGPTFIPFVFEGGIYPDHIVLIIIDPLIQEVSYYDPQGLPPDHPDRMTLDGFNMAEALAQIRDLVEEQENYSFKINVNPTIHQEDTQDCGIYVCRFMNKYLEDPSFYKLCAEEVGQETIMEYRDLIAKDIIKRWEYEKTIQPLTEEGAEAVDSFEDVLGSDSEGSSESDHKKSSDFDDFFGLDTESPYLKHGGTSKSSSSGESS